MLLQQRAHGNLHSLWWPKCPCVNCLTVWHMSWEFTLAAFQAHTQSPFPQHVLLAYEQTVWKHVLHTLLCHDDDFSHSAIFKHWSWTYYHLEIYYYYRLLIQYQLMSWTRCVWNREKIKWYTAREAYRAGLSNFVALGYDKFETH